MQDSFLKRLLHLLTVEAKGKGVLKLCSKFTGEHPRGSVISMKVLQFSEITFRHECASANLLHIFRTFF